MTTKTSPDKILAIGGSDHDTHACAVIDGKVTVAIEEERISRKKYGLGGNLMEGLARNYVLRESGLQLEDFDQIVVDAILPKTATLAVRKRAKAIDHHLCHAASAYFPSGFSAAAVLVVDNAGGLVGRDGDQALQATTWYHAKERTIGKIGQVTSGNWKEGPIIAGAPYQRGDGDDSLGHFYKKISGALGYRYPHDAPANGFFFPEDGVTMGLAAFAEPEYLQRFMDVIELLPAGRFRIPLNDGRLDRLLTELLGDDPEDFDKRAILASSAQAALEQLLFHLVNHVVEATGEGRLCLAGGVAMNSVANAKILKHTSAEEIYIPPVPGDNGTAIGAALWTASRNPDAPVPVYSVYAGGHYGDEAIDAALAELDGKPFSVQKLPEEALLAAVVKLLVAGKVIAWFNGGSENGRRALGNRSILASAQSAETRDHINHRVKQRHWFRPLAPVVPEEDAADYFDIPQPSPYMQMVFPVRQEQREHLGAVTHIDGSARVQTVNQTQNPRLYRLLRSYQQASGIPVLLNTSFNGRGEPIVETPREAVECLLRMPLDALIIEDRLVIRT